jgi:RNHCP domain
MDLYEAILRPEHGRAKSKHTSKAHRPGRARHDGWREQQYGDFECCHCRLGVSAAPLLSGVHNRNHCPYCLWSKHVDLRAAGDRLCACKAPMRPAGLTFKRVRKKYAPHAVPRGELMLVHHCAACGAFSLNRLAADDSPARVWEVFEASLLQPPAAVAGIAVLGATQRAVVRAMVLGNEVPE